MAWSAVSASKTCADRGPETRTTATPAGPALPVASAKIVSSDDDGTEGSDDEEKGERAVSRSPPCCAVAAMVVVLEPSALAADSAHVREKPMVR